MVEEKEIGKQRTCLLCNKTKFSLLYDLKPIENVPFSILKCLNCGLTFIHPLPQKEDIEKYYRSYYNLQINSEYSRGISLNYKDTYMSEIINNRLNCLKKYCPYGKLLDIGCGTGVFLDEARENGWEVTGIDIADDAVQYARDKFKLEVFQGELDSINLPAAHFDVITMWDLIEHLENPLAILKKANKILKDKGKIVILTPNENSLIKKIIFLFFKLSGKRWDFLVKKGYGIHHLYYFSDKNIKELLKKAGFGIIKVVKRETSIEEMIRETQEDWTKPGKKLVLFCLKIIFFFARLINQQNKMMVIAEKIL